LKTTKVTRGDVIQSVVYILLYLAAITGGAFWLLPQYWVLWVFVVLGGLAILVNWHASSTAYQCPHCGSTFEISFLTDLLAPHGINGSGGWLLLRCPHCCRWGKATVLKRLN